MFSFDHTPMTSTTELLTISGVDDAAITATSDALALRDELLARARKGTIVTTPESAEKAGSILKEVKAFTRLIEDARKIVKEQPLKLCRDIDALASKLVSELETEATRISRLLGAWQAEQNRIAEEARRKAWEEEQRIKREAEEKARAEALRVRKEQEELELKASRARSDEKAAEWRAKAAQREEESQTASAAHVAQTEQAIVETRVAAAAIAPPKPAGLATRKEVCFEVTDIQALYDAAPFLVTMSPNNAAIKAAVKGLSSGQSLPGVRHWEENKTIVR